MEHQETDDIPIQVRLMWCLFLLHFAPLYLFVVENVASTTQVMVGIGHFLLIAIICLSNVTVVLRDWTTRKYGALRLLLILTLLLLFIGIYLGIMAFTEGMTSDWCRQAVFLVGFLLLDAGCIFMGVDMVYRCFDALEEAAKPSPNQ